jgi:hypothetical protein
MKSKVLVFAVAFVAILLFENCTPSTLSFSNNESHSTQSTAPGGNSQGYDGKVYVHELAVGTCADGAKVDTKIAILSSNSVLLRDNCVNLKPADHKPVAVTQDPNDVNAVLFNGTKLSGVPASMCSTSNVVIPDPMVDLKASSYLGSGDVWTNLGTGGVAYDFHRGTPANPNDFAPFVSGNPSYWLMRGDDTLWMDHGETAFTNTLHHKGAVYTFIFEGYLSSGKQTAIIANGSLNNMTGIGLYYADSKISFKVGNSSSTSSDCAVYSLCADGPTIGPAATPQNLFAAVSINEPTGAGYLQANELVQPINATYSQDAAAFGPAHQVDIGGIWEGKLDTGSRVYRLRVWNSALNDLQLKSLYNQSSGYCPW